MGNTKSQLKADIRVKGQSINTTLGTSKTEMPVGSMTGMSVATRGKMPSGIMPPVPTATLTGMTITEMPTGSMTTQVNVASGNMLGGAIPPVSTASLTGMTGMPQGRMILKSSLASAKMFSNTIASASNTAMAGLTITGMPAGNMTGAQRHELKNIELSTMKLTGEWHLTLFPHV
jgi:hypothetical protein